MKITNKKSKSKKKNSLAAAVKALSTKTAWFIVETDKDYADVDHPEVGTKFFFTPTEAVEELKKSQDGSSGNNTLFFLARTDYLLDLKTEVNTTVTETELE